MTSDEHLKTADQLLSGIGNMIAKGKTPDSAALTAMVTVVLAHIEIAKALREQEIMRDL